MDLDNYKKSRKITEDAFSLKSSNYFGPPKSNLEFSKNNSDFIEKNGFEKFLENYYIVSKINSEE